MKKKVGSYSLLLLSTPFQLQFWRRQLCVWHSWNQQRVVSETRHLRNWEDVVWKSGCRNNRRCNQVSPSLTHKNQPLPAYNQRLFVLQSIHRRNRKIRRGHCYRKTRSGRLYSLRNGKKWMPRIVSTRGHCQTHSGVNCSGTRWEKRRG